MSAGSAYPKRRLDVRARTVSGRLHIARGPELYELSDVAATIWRSADGSKSLDAIAETVTEEFDVERERAYSDVKTFVSDLAERGFLDLRHGPED